MVPLIVPILAALAIGYLVYLTYYDKQKVREERRLEESLEDEYIYHPETGTKITLEEAEKGKWNMLDQDVIIPEKIIQKRYPYNEHQVIRCYNELVRRDFHSTKLTVDQHEEFARTVMMQQYYDWEIHRVFANDDGHLVLFITIYYIIHHRYGRSEEKSDVKLLSWQKVDRDYGHYLLTRETLADKVVDAIDNDDEIKLNGYEPTTISPAPSVITTNHFLQKLEGIEDLVIEIESNNFYLKSDRIARPEDLENILHWMKKIDRAAFRLL